MLRLWRYLLREALYPALAGVLVYTGLFLINLLYQLAELAFRHQVPASVVGRFLLLGLPRVLALTVPMAVLLGILIGMGRLAADGELVALRACGVSFAGMLPPMLLLGAAGAALGAFLAHKMVPEASYAQHRLNAEVFLAGDPERMIQPGTFFQEIPGLLVYSRRRETDGALGGVILFQREQDGAGRLTMARRARIQPDRRTGGIRIRLQEGESHWVRPGDPRIYERSRFQEEELLRPPDPAVLQFVDTLRGPLPRNHREMLTPDLWRKLAEPLPASATPGARADRTGGLVELHRRMAVPFAALIFAVLAPPLGGITRRGSRSAGFALSLAVVVAYWLLGSAGENLAKSASIPVWTVVWAPNVLFLALGVALNLWLWRDRRLPRWLRFRRRRAGRVGAAPTAGTTPETPPRGRRRRGAGGVPWRLDRYLVGQFLRLLALVALSFLVVQVLVDLRTLLDDVIENETATGGMVARYVLRSLPGMLTQALPLACLLAGLLAPGLLERRNEITAMKAAGLSVHRLSLPLLLAALALCGLQFYLSDAVVPPASQDAAVLRARIRNVQPVSMFAVRQWFFGANGHLYNFAAYSPSADEFQGVSIYRFSPDGLSLRERVEAATARHRDGRWTLHDGWVRRFGGNDETFREFQEEIRDIRERPEYFRREARPPAQMTFRELSGHVRELQRGGYDVREALVALHEKVSSSLVPLVLVLLGLGFGFRRGVAGGSAAAVGLALVLAIGYFACLAAFRQLGGMGMLPAALAAWSPDLLFAGAGAYRWLSLPT